VRNAKIHFFLKYKVFF